MNEYTSANNDINEGGFTLELDKNAQQAHADLDAYKVILEGGKDSPVRNIDSNALFDHMEHPGNPELEAVGREMTELMSLLKLLPVGEDRAIFESIILREMELYLTELKQTPDEIEEVLGRYEGYELYKELRANAKKAFSEPIRPREAQRQWYTNVLGVLDKAMDGLADISHTELEHRIMLIEGILSKQQGQVLSGYVDFDGMPDLGVDENNQYILFDERTYMPNIQATIQILKSEQQRRTTGE